MVQLIYLIHRKSYIIGRPFEASSCVVVLAASSSLVAVGELLVRLESSAPEDADNRGW